MTKAEVSVLVVGAGVSGLTTALELCRAGYGVEIISAERTTETTSMAAGALWGPYLVEPLEKVARWSRESLQEFERLASVGATTGVQILTGTEASRHPADAPPWSAQLSDFRMCDVSELPDGFTSGWTFSAPMINMPTFLGYLETKIKRRGVRLRFGSPIESLEQAVARADLVVNCSGAGAQSLVPDSSITAIKGHLIVLPNPGISEFFSEETGDSPDLTHIYPQGETVVLGGVAQDGNWDRQADPETGRAILKRCSAIDERLLGLPILEHRTGLRPTRPEVCLELVEVAGTPVVHNYGHGGAGVTLSWGCAREAVEVVASAI